MRTERKTIENIILIYPLIYGLQDRIDGEQEILISDLTSPAIKVANKLIELDNRRIDLCNLTVLYGFIERGLREQFGLLRACVFGGISAPQGLYMSAVASIAAAGYTVERVNKEFEYLFKLIKKKRPLKVKSGADRVYTSKKQTLGNVGV